MTNQPAKILIAEDGAFLLKLYTAKLTEAGFTVVGALDGEEAINKATSEAPNIILLDMLMPKKNGYEILAALKANPALASIPVIIFSSLEQDEDVQKGLAAGASDYVTKSESDTAGLIAKINKLLPAA